MPQHSRARAVSALVLRTHHPSTVPLPGRHLRALLRPGVDGDYDLVVIPPPSRAHPGPSGRLLRRYATRVVPTRGRV